MLNDNLIFYIGSTILKKGLYDFSSWFATVIVQENIRIYPRKVTKQCA